MDLVIYRKEGMIPSNSWIRYLLSRIKKNKNNLITIVGPTGCQPAGSQVMMTDGSWKGVEDIQVGDRVMSPDGKGGNTFAKVVNTTKWFSKENYEVRELNRQNRKLYTCSSNHLIPVYHCKYPRVKGIRNKEDRVWGIKNYSAHDFDNLSSKGKAHNNIGISSFPINSFEGKTNCIIEPYTLGIFLGDGMFWKKITSNRMCRVLTITTADTEVIDEVKKHYPIMSIRSNGENNKSKNYAFSMDGDLPTQLKEYGLEGGNSGTKFIPRDALTSDIHYRKKLLSGLIDSDGYYKKGGYSITTKSYQLATDIMKLVYSLGGRGSLRKVTKQIK